MSTVALARFRAVILLTKFKILLLLAFARVVYGGMSTQAARFPSPVPPLANLLAEIVALDAAQQVVASGIHGASTEARNTARDAVWSSLLSLRAYVQKIADASLENSLMIIKSAGFNAAAPGGHDKPVLAAQITGVSGAVKLAANVHVLTGGTRKQVSYNWQYSTDGGRTWVLAPGTPRASTIIVGLPAAAYCSFRVSVTIAKTVQPWSQAVTILVH